MGNLWKLYEIVHGNYVECGFLMGHSAISILYGSIWDDKNDVFPLRNGYPQIHRLQNPSEKVAAVWE